MPERSTAPPSDRLSDRTSTVRPGPAPDPLPDALRPDWPAPAGVQALMSTRLGGVSAAPFDSLNLRPPQLPGDAVDDPACVAENQRRFAQALGATPVWLDQVHGVRVHRLGGAGHGRSGLTSTGAPAGAMVGPRGLPQADAAISTEPGLAATVLVADCLPVLLCSRSGRVVGAAHAGWRGLAGGVLAHTVRAMCEASGDSPADLMAWLGPCIGPEAFEVGADVLAAFGVQPETASGARAGAGADTATVHGPRQALFRYQPRPDGAPRWRADLAGLARAELQGLGLGAAAVHGGRWCTFSAPERFFSYRRQPVTGRLAAGIALRG